MGKGACWREIVMLPTNSGETSKGYENGKGGRRQYGEKDGLEGDVRGAEGGCGRRRENGRGVWLGWEKMLAER